jgi:hypothetical protein
LLCISIKKVLFEWRNHKRITQFCQEPRILGVLPHGEKGGMAETGSALRMMLHEMEYSVTLREVAGPRVS